MDEIPQDSVDRMMVKCARRCCICRRFRPTKLQVHHIVPRSQGGTDDDDNLIVTCISCHADVHSQVPFTRRFSTEELKGHRDALIRMVAEGTFPADETDNADAFIGNVLAEVVVVPGVTGHEGLSREAIEILLRAAHAEGKSEGMIVLTDGSVGFSVFPGNQLCPYRPGDHRAEAKYKAALDELLRRGLIEYRSESLREVTHVGYLAADDIASSRG